MDRTELLDLISEEWRPVKGWEGLYEVSNQGRIRTVEHQIKVNRSNTASYEYVIKSKIKKLGKCNTGYLTAALSKNGKTINVQVHTIVAEAFIPNPNNFKIVNHIDNNKINNVVSNLEWCSYRGNNLHAVWNRCNKQAIAVKCIEDGKIFPSLSECNRYYKLGSQHDSSYLSSTGEAHPKLGLHFKRIMLDLKTYSIQELNIFRNSDCNYND